MNEIIAENISDQESLLADMQKLEKEVMYQLNLLSETMPEIYSGYADIIRETMDGALRILSLDEKKQNTLAAVAEIAARCVKSWGAWKSAKRHNQMLLKLMETKKIIAQTNINKVKFLLPRTQKLVDISFSGFDAICKKEFQLTDNDKETAVRTASLCCRMLHLYRANFFLNQLTEYLCEEYKAWLEGSQTSGMLMPDYFAVNDWILDKICPGEAFAELESAADSDGNLKGYQLMLLGDPQLTATVLIIKDGLFEYKAEEASLAVSAILSENRGLKKYLGYTRIVKSFITDNETSFMGFYVFGAILVLGLICFFYMETSMWSRILLFVSSLAASIKIYRSNLRRYEEDYCNELVALSEEKEAEVYAYCGKVEQLEIDYEEKSQIIEMAKGFLGI